MVLLLQEVVSLVILQEVVEATIVDAVLLPQVDLVDKVIRRVMRGIPIIAAVLLPCHYSVALPLLALGSLDLVQGV